MSDNVVYLELEDKIEFRAEGEAEVIFTVDDGVPTFFDLVEEEKTARAVEMFWDFYDMEFQDDLEKLQTSQAFVDRMKELLR